VSSGEFIAASAAHWRVEPYIPLNYRQLVEYLRQRGELTGQALGDWEAGVVTIDHELTMHYRHLDQSMDDAYPLVDPDVEVRLLGERTESDRKRAAADSVSLLVEALRGANYTQLSRIEIEKAIAAVSHWGLRLLVDLDAFAHLQVWARGDVMGVRTMRNWKTAFRCKRCDVAIYQRLVVLFQLEPGQLLEDQFDDGGLHVRIFKNIPQADVDMLLPVTRVKLGWFDQTKILVPTISGVGMNIWKIARGLLLLAFVGIYGTLALTALVIAATGYAIRSGFQYARARDRQLLQLTRSLYYQKLDHNAGAIARVTTEALQQDARESVLAYYVLLRSGEPVRASKLAQRVTRLIREAIDVVVDFEVDDALRKLHRFGLAECVDSNEDAQSLWVAVRPKPTAN
jgi:hypothetical protein